VARGLQFPLDALDPFSARSSDLFDGSTRVAFRQRLLILRSDAQPCPLMKLYLLLILLTLLPFLAQLESFGPSERKQTAPASSNPESVVAAELPLAVPRSSSAGVQPVTAHPSAPSQASAPSAKSSPAP
jgi:hypothetical protein